MEAGTGILLVVLAGALNSSFTLPMKWTSKWAWENTWLVFSVVGMVVVNWGIALRTVPHLVAVYTQAGSTAVCMVFIFGVIWGISNVLFGLSIDAIGMSLTFPICIGLSTALGSLIPMARHPAVFQTPSGIVTTLGIATILAGVWLCTRAGIGMNAQIEQSAAPVNPLGAAPLRRSLVPGLILATLSGVLDPWFNYAFAFGDTIKQQAGSLGASKAAEADAIWSLALLGSCGVTASYCLWLLWRNATWSRFWQTGTSTHWWLAALMGLIWMFSVTLYGRGAALMGPLGGSIGWALFYACIIICSNLWGFAAGEWKGGSGRPLRTMLAGLGVLLLAVGILSYANGLTGELID